MCKNMPIILPVLHQEAMKDAATAGLRNMVSECGTLWVILVCYEIKICLRLCLTKNARLDNVALIQVCNEYFQYMLHYVAGMLQPLQSILKIFQSADLHPFVCHGERLLYF